jgi:elongation of very long chain fatty acids protein 4
LICNKTDVDSETGYWRAWVIWVYYAQKYFEFLDTVFIVLKQSWRQFSFLHVYHHASVALLVRQFVLYDINGDCFLAAFLNA